MSFYEDLKVRSTFEGQVVRLDLSGENGRITT